MKESNVNLPHHIALALQNELKKTKTEEQSEAYKSIFIDKNAQDERTANTSFISTKGGSLNALM